MTGREVAALAAPGILASVLERERQQWVCGQCGASTPRLSEICSGCGLEDCEQGGTDWAALDAGLVQGFGREARGDGLG